MHLRVFLFTVVLAEAAAAAGDPNRGANLVILDETAVKNLNLATVEAEEADFEETIFALGRIRAAPGHRGVVSSRVAGRAITVGVHIDTRIEKGAEAVVIESRQPGDPPATVRLFAPVSGYVSAVHVVPGQPVEPTDSLIEIVDLSAVHAVAALPEHFANRVQIGQQGYIRAQGYPDRMFVAEIEHLGTEVDVATGALEVAFHVENPGSILRPGMRAEFSVVTGKREGVMSIPSDALQGDGAQRFVYIADYELKHAYLKTPVVLGAQNDRMVEVTNGVLPGDQVVTRGAYALVFAGKGNTSLKEALDAAHGHPHGDDGSELTEEQAKGLASNDGSAADNSRAGGLTPLATFFAGATGVLFVLLLMLGSQLRKRTAA